MKITIKQPYAYSQIGRKDNQEDAVYPLIGQATTAQRCFVLCDGVGGSAHGEIASRTTCDVIGANFDDLLKQKLVATPDDMQQATTLAYDKLNKVATSDDPNSMATTLTCICIHDEGVLIGHMGDSRIYQVRPGQGIMYQSTDHSLINALLMAGELTPEEAEVFPRKNVITKALQPHTDKRYKTEVHQLTDIQTGDYFFLCCDGVLEQLTNDRLVEILSMPVSDKEKIQYLEAESTDKTKDNYTAYLVPIDTVEGKSTLLEETEEALAVSLDEEVSETRNNFNGKTSNAGRNLTPAKKQVLPKKEEKKSYPVEIGFKLSMSKTALYVIGIVLLLVAGYFLYQTLVNEKPKQFEKSEDLKEIIENPSKKETFAKKETDEEETTTKGPAKVMASEKVVDEESKSKETSVTNKQNAEQTEESVTKE